MTNKTKYHIAYFFLIIFSAISVIWAVYLIWGARSYKVVFAGESGEKIADSSATKMALSLDGVLDTPFIGAKSNPFGPGASIDLAASTRPKGDWKTITAYNAEIAQTDSNPRIMASGKEVREGFVAYNCAPFGTRMIIEGREYEVQDRMAKKWGCGRVDIFMENYQSALRFGKQRKQVIILE